MEILFIIAQFISLLKPDMAHYINCFKLNGLFNHHCVIHIVIINRQATLCVFLKYFEILLNTQ